MKQARRKRVKTVFFSLNRQIQIVFELRFSASHKLLPDQLIKPRTGGGALGQQSEQEPGQDSCVMASCAAVRPRGPDPVRAGGDSGGGWGVFEQAEVKELSFHPAQHVDVVVCCFSSSCKTHEVEAGPTPCWTRPGPTS